MIITFLDHSGFCVEHEDVVLIFDYYRGGLPVFDVDKRVYVFASHGHRDHFQRSILKWDEQFGRIRFILSDDIGLKETRSRVFLGAHEEWEEDGLKVRTLPSTDMGVAFLVNYRGRSVYHGGDLNWWYWDGEPESDNERMRLDYQAYVGELAGVHIDVAFLPLDPRQGEQFAWGFDWFMKHTDTEAAFPMHMWGKYRTCDRLMALPETEDYRSRIVPVTYAGERFEV